MATAAKKEIVYTTVAMDDGRTVDFAGKRKMIKETTFNETTDVISVRLDFVNGETRTFTVPELLVAKFTAHGAEQKLGDEIAGLNDVDDCVLAIDSLMERLEGGNWSVQRDNSSLAGTSILARALVEHSKKSPQQVKDFLAGKTQAEKVALRQNAAIAPIVARLESEKTKVKSKVDTDALLDELA
jgi:hypothetical protein